MFLTLPVVDSTIETPRTRGLRLALGGRPFDFCAGQAVRVGRHGQRLRKPYSIACAPEQARAGDAIELLVQVGADGSAGSHLDSMAPGTLIDIEGPVGDFCFPPNPFGRRLLFVAGGTGIAPLRAMLQHALLVFPDRTCALFYSARRAEEFAYGDQMRALARRGTIVLRETVTRDAGATWTGERGRMTRAQIAELVEAGETSCFVCGPPPMVQDVTGWLREIGVPEERVLAEGWT